MSASTSSSSSSSSQSSTNDHEQEDPQDQDSTAAAQRLKLLNAYLLNSSLFDLAPVVEPTKAPKRVEGKPVEKNELQPESSVAFRLFSSQVAPTKIVLQEAEERWPTVADPRIRAVEDEPKAVYKARQKAIKATCIPGSTVLEAKTIWGPLHPERVIHRRLVRAPNSTPDAFPRLAYFDYRLDPTDSQPSTERPQDPSKLAKSTKPINHRALKRRGLRCDLKKRLLVKPILKEDKGIRKLPKRRALKGTGKAIEGTKKEVGSKGPLPARWTPLGRKRLSKKRRAKKANA
ncbi:BQ2448_6589 [Microbotryum intermedium]|uniref:BQ2448_6589 protein n=1 Tax=Microbotryum intermedium TaxID=269621 RepID=A0A238FLN0_9BASI|nr:BQ2448_6589 [Microbotryum intermedium]